jgi:carboxyl-terminal processing protease
MIFFNFFKKTLLLTIFSAFLGLSLQVSAEEVTIKKQKIESFLKDLEDFTVVFSDIKQLYVDDVDNKKLFNNAIKGMVSGLDPHSAYLEPKEQQDLMENASGKFAGLGIVISKKDDGIQVISPIDDTPAYRAGIQAGDLIIKIGDKPVRDMTLEDGVDLMRGDPGTKINITILRKNQKPFAIDITREIITIVTVKGYLLEENIGYVRISSFQDPTANLLKETVAKLVKKNGNYLKSLVLDLRNNPGGVLNGAIDVSNLFIDKDGLVVYTEGRVKSSNLEFETERGDILLGVPMVVLINNGSASASEIVAGALQDHKRAIIMGSTSFGKGSVQTVIELDGGYGLKVTTARYYTPNGRSIQAKGIVPDIELKNISLEKEKEKPVINFKENDLAGHLEQENPNDMSAEEILDDQEKIQTSLDKKAVKKLQKDYFVHEATNLLKALTILGK